MSSAEATSRGKPSLTVKVMVGMLIGLVIGVVFNRIGSAWIDTYVVGGLFAIIGTMFVNALKHFRRQPGARAGSANCHRPRAQDRTNPGAAVRT